MAGSGLFSLTELRMGDQGTIVRLDGGHGSLGRLAALGFTPGAAVLVVRNPGRGPIIVSILDTQIALGQGQADRIQVRKHPERVR